MIFWFFDGVGLGEGLFLKVFALVPPVLLRCSPPFALAPMPNLPLQFLFCIKNMFGWMCVFFLRYFKITSSQKANIRYVLRSVNVKKTDAEGLNVPMFLRGAGSSERMLPRLVAIGPRQVASKTTSLTTPPKFNIEPEHGGFQ